MKTETKYNILVWCYRIFCYLVPCGYALWDFLIKNLIEKDITIMQKLGLSGIFIGVIMFLIAVFFYGRHLKKQKDKYTDLCIECTDETKKKEYIAKKHKIESKQDLFRNICFIAPFVLMWLLMSSIERGVVSLRGTFMCISISMAVGFGFNGLAQWVKNRGDKK